MSSLDQLKQFSELASSLSNDDAAMLEAFTQVIQASAANRMANAISELNDAGVNYQDYIPMSRQAIRAKQQLQRLQHEQRMQDLEFRAKQAEVIAAEASAKRISQPRQQQPQRTMPPVPAPPQQQPQQKPVTTP